MSHVKTADSINVPVDCLQLRSVFTWWIIISSVQDTVSMIASCLVQASTQAVVHRTKLHWRPRARHNAALVVSRVHIPHQTLLRWSKTRRLLLLLPASCHGNCLPTERQNLRWCMRSLSSVLVVTSLVLISTCRFAYTWLCEADLVQVKMLEVFNSQLWTPVCRQNNCLSLQMEVSAAKVRNLQPTWGSVVSYHYCMLHIAEVVFWLVWLHNIGNMCIA